MFKGKLVLVAATLALAAGPAFAEEGIGVGTQFAGEVTSTSVDPTSIGASVPQPWTVSGDCDFEGVTRGNGIQFAWGGRAVSTSHDYAKPRIPTYTELTCTLYSLQGPGDPEPEHSVSKTVGTGLPVTVVIDRDEPLSPIWPLRATKICISGYALFGPEDPQRVDIPARCKTNALLP